MKSERCEKCGRFMKNNWNYNDEKWIRCGNCGTMIQIKEVQRK